jgi:HEAT repeat protein
VTGRRPCCSLAMVFLLICVIDQPLKAVKPQTRQLVEEFQASDIFWRQLDVGKKIIELQGKEVLGALEPWLEHEDRHIRGNVAFVFAALGHRRGLDVIAGILNDYSVRPEGQASPGGRWSLKAQIRADRYYAVHLLGELKQVRGVDLLLPLLRDEEVNYKAAWALGEIGDVRAVGPLIAALQYGTALMRISAIQGLEKLRAKEAIPHLRLLVADRELPSAGDQISVGEAAKAAILTLEKTP